MHMGHLAAVSCRVRWWVVVISKEPGPMEREDYLQDIHIRILRVTEDLRAIQRQLNCAAMEAPSDPELMEALSQLPEMDALQVLKSSVDQMRHFLWFYMQVMTNESEIWRKIAAKYSPESFRGFGP